MTRPVEHGVHRERRDVPVLLTWPTRSRQRSKARQARDYIRSGRLHLETLAGYNQIDSR
jgi:hypothetical protein